MASGHQWEWAEVLNDARDLDLDNLALDVEPSDRVGTPLPNRRRAKLRRAFFGIVLLAGTWSFAANDPERAQGLLVSSMSFLEDVVARARAMASRPVPETTPLSSVASDAAGLLPPIATTASVEQSGGAVSAMLASTQVEISQPTGNEESQTGSIGTAYAETSATDEPEDKSPKRKQAVAVGLSPDLPNILLTRLSEADLKNAGYAIKTALAKTPDDASFAWPTTPSRKQALFEVRFVPGAAEGCRRYIVTVTKDHWSSTSAALEKCGESPPQPG